MQLQMRRKGGKRDKHRKNDKGSKGGQQRMRTEAAVLQQRLYCIKARATKPAPTDFFDKESPLREELETITESYFASAVNSPCLTVSNAGSVPGEGVCKVLRP